jgi:hypothetical protein
LKTCSLLHCPNAWLAKEFTRIWAGSAALRRPGWRFRFDDRDEHLGAIDHNAH